MRFDIHIHHHMDPEQRALLLDIREGLIMISAEVQAMLDKARESATLVASVDAGMSALRMQLDEQGKKIDALQVAAAATPTTPAVSGISAEDKAALLEGASILDTTISTLQRDIPTNVTAVVAPAPAPVIADPASHEEDARAASQATPLPGTGVLAAAAEGQPAAAAGPGDPNAPAIPPPNRDVLDPNGQPATGGTPEPNAAPSGSGDSAPVGFFSEADKPKDAGANQSFTA